MLDPHSPHSIGIHALVNGLWHNQQLIWQLTRRDIVGRYRGSFFGITWAFFHPLVMLIVYTFVFSVVFQARIGGVGDSKTDFALGLFIGMIIHGMFSECINRTPTLVVNNKAYVKKVVFPLEILPWNVMCAALFHAAISFLVWFLFYLSVGHEVSWSYLYFPLIVLPFIFMTMGVSWFLASVGVFVRDIGHVTGVVTTMLLFLSPIFYSPSILPEPYRSFIYINPLTYFIEQSRNVLLYGIAPDWTVLIMVYLAALLTMWMGYIWFQKTRKGFADVL